MKTKDDQERGGEQRFRLILICGLALGAIVGMLLDDLAGGILLGLLAGYLVAWRVTGQELPITTMKYGPGRLRAVVVWLGLYFVALLAMLRILESELANPWRWLGASLPLIPGVGLVWSLGRAFASLDEFQRRIQSEALAIGFGLAVLVITGYGFLEIAGAPPLNWLYAGAVLAGGAVVGKIWTQWKYR